MKEVRLQTDVLVIGAGGAGARAAVAAKESGVDVLLVSKGPIGRSGITPVAGWGLQAALGHVDGRDSPEQHFLDTIQAGRGLADQNLVRVLAMNAPECVFDLNNYGTKIRKVKEGFQQVQDPGETYPRSICLENGGYGLMAGLKKEIKRQQVETMEDVIITKIIAENGRVQGALGLDLKNGNFLVFNAPAIVLATGGNEELWSLSSTPPGCAGDGHYLAYHAGAELVDMEMVLFYPTVVVAPDIIRKVILEYETCLDARKCAGKLVNNKGDELIIEGLPVRDVMVDLISREIAKGHGTENGGVYLDLVNSERTKDEIVSYLKDVMPGILSYLQKLGVDILEEKLEVAPGIHYTLGGVRIDESAATNIEGLFAAGEVAGNVHGANRLSGNALTETQVFGKIAGENAAAYSIFSENNDVKRSSVTRHQKELLQFFENKENGIRPAEIKKELQQVIGQYAGYYRNKKGLEKALADITRMKSDKLPRLSVEKGKSYNLELLEGIECKFMLDVAEMICRGALTRQESRGHHYREDFPERDDDNWLAHTMIKKENGMTVDRIPVELLEDFEGEFDGF